MPGTRHDSSLAALHASTGLPGSVVDVVVLTADTGLLATLRDGSGQEHALWHASAAEIAVDLLVGGRCGILIADLETLRGDVTLLEQLQRQFPELVLLATGRREEEQAVAALVASGHIYRFLHKPVSPARAKLFLGTATRRYHELRNTEPTPTIAVAPAERSASWVRLAAAAAMVIAALAAVWLLTRTAPEESPAPVTPAANTSSTEQQVADLLGHAQMAYAADRLAEPKGNNALHYFRSALALDPRSVDAHAGVERVLRTLEARVTEALAARNAERAVGAFIALQRAAPDHPRLDSLRAQLLAISRARPEATAIEPSPRVTTSRPVPVVTAPGIPNIDAARARIVAGELTEPDGDSAIDYLRRARAATEDRSRLATAATDAGLKALALTEAAIAASDATQGQRWLAAARLFDSEFDLALPRVEDIAGRLSALTAGREAIERDLAAAVLLRERGQLLAPAGNNAYEHMSSLRERAPASAAVQEEQVRLASAMHDRTRTALAAGNLEEAQALLQRTDAVSPGMSVTRSLQQELAAARAASDFMKNVVPVTSLTLKRSVPPRYPPLSERDDIEGYVDVEFTVAVDGTTRDLVVKAAQPAEVFDKAAVDAVSQWRFEPVLKNGSPAPQRAAVRVRFQLK